MFLPLAVQALYRSLEELAVCGQIPLELLPAIIHQYDLVLFTALSERGGGGGAGGRGGGVAEAVRWSPWSQRKQQQQKLK